MNEYVTTLLFEKQTDLQTYWTSNMCHYKENAKTTVPSKQNTSSVILSLCE